MLNNSMVVATLPVTDLERSRAFYGETLGLTFLWDNPASVRFRCGDGLSSRSSGAGRAPRITRSPTSR